MANKKIFIDGLGLVEGHFSGIGQYILGILKGMDQIIEEDKYNGEDVPRIIVIIPRDTVKKFKKFNFKHIEYKAFPLPFRYMAALWHRGKLPPLDLLFGRGVYIFPRFVGMPLLFSKSLLTVFDLSFELHKEYSDEGNARFLSRYTGRYINKAQKVITISNSVKKEILDFFKVADSKVAVAYPATDPSIMYRRSKKEIEEVKRRYSIEGDYILALSNLEPRKNLSELVDAYCGLPKHLTDKYSLLLVGVSGWKTETLFNHIVKKVDDGFNILRPSDYVKDEDKAAIISGSSMLVYPSHYEGFGMPPLEALACGVPVISADNSSLPEAVGEAGRLINIDEGGMLQSVIKESLDNIDDLQSRSVIRGPTHAHKFSWKKSAQVYLDAAKEFK